jgi:hypothetical protein
MGYRALQVSSPPDTQLLHIAIHNKTEQRSLSGTTQSIPERPAEFMGYRRALQVTSPPGTQLLRIAMGASGPRGGPTEVNAACSPRAEPGAGLCKHRLVCIHGLASEQLQPARKAGCRAEATCGQRGWIGKARERQ